MFLRGCGSTQSSEQGAQTQIFLAATNKLDLAASSGEYFDNSAQTATSDAGRNMDTAAWLWNESEKLTGVRF